MQKFDIHLCLISDQATPNLTPILDPQCRPREVLMLVSQQMQDKAQRLSQVYRRYQVSSRLIPVADAYDLRELEEQCLAIIAEYEDCAIALNVTGGTKPMAIAAEHAFAAAGKPIFYIHPQDNTLFLLGNKTQPWQLANKLTLHDYLPAHGYDLISSENTQLQDGPTAQLVNLLVNYATTYSQAIGRLNWLAQQAEDDKTREISDSNPADPNFDHLFDSIQHAGLASRTGNRIRFADEDAIRFLKGGWLERHVFDIAQTLPKKQEAVFNLQVRSQSAGHSTNEIDVAILAQNRLHVIECKTSRMDNRDRRSDDLTYKLDSLSELGGLNTRTMLVSFQKVNQATLNRAKDLRIKVVDAQNLRNLRQIMNEWINSK